MNVYILNSFCKHERKVMQLPTPTPEDIGRDRRVDIGVILQRGDEQYGKSARNKLVKRGCRSVQVSRR